MGNRLRWWHVLVFAAWTLLCVQLGCRMPAGYYFGPGS